MYFKFMSLTQTFFLNSRLKTSNHLINICPWTPDSSLRLCLVRNWPPVSCFQMRSNLGSFVSVSVGSGVSFHGRTAGSLLSVLWGQILRSCQSGNPVDSAFAKRENLITLHHFSFPHALFLLPSVLVESCSTCARDDPVPTSLGPCPSGRVQESKWRGPCPLSSLLSHTWAFFLIYADPCAPSNMPAHFRPPLLSWLSPSPANTCQRCLHDWPPLLQVFPLMSLSWRSPI